MFTPSLSFALYRAKLAKTKPKAKVIINEILFIKAYEKQAIQTSKDLIYFNHKWKENYSFKNIACALPRQTFKLLQFYKEKTILVIGLKCVVPR